MLPDLTVLIALLLGLATLEGSPADPARALLGSVACVLIGCALSRMAFARGASAMADDDDLAAEASMRWTTLWPFVAWVAAIFFFQWGSWVNVSVPRMWWIARFAVLLMPAVVLFCVGWYGRAQLEAKLLKGRGLTASVLTGRDGVRRGLRKNGIVFIPIFLIIALTEGIWLAGALGVESLRIFSLWQEASGLLTFGVMFGIIILALPAIPWLMARALHAKPLAPGRIRSVLEEASKTIGLRYADICVWPTGERVINAMVVGFTGGTRRIILTDGILKAMPEDELLAVFFHEAGHAKRHHLTQFLLLFFSLSLLVYAADSPLTALGVPPWALTAMHLAVIWFVILGWFSRRFERESDIYGAEHAAVLQPDAPAIPVPGLPRPLPRGAALMMRALERVRALAGHSGGHRHGTIEDRIAFVAHHAIDPGARLAHERSRRTLMFIVAAVLACAIGVTALALPTEVARAEAHVMFSDAIRDYKAAWSLEHARESADVAKAPARWKVAYSGFLAAWERLEGQDDLLARSQRVDSVYNAGDTALRGLKDPAAAHKHLTEALAQIKAIDAEGSMWALLRFHAHIDLGRISAWNAVANPTERGPDFKTTLEHLADARTLLRERLDSAEDLGTQRELLDERLRLLQATYDGARGETAVARKALEQLAQLGVPGARTYSTREEIASDARAELARLP